MVIGGEASFAAGYGWDAEQHPGHYWDPRAEVWEVRPVPDPTLRDAGLPATPGNTWQAAEMYVAILEQYGKMPDRTNVFWQASDRKWYRGQPATPPPPPPDPQVARMAARENLRTRAKQAAQLNYVTDAELVEILQALA
jgi:hypothetical protein